MKSRTQDTYEKIRADILGARHLPGAKLKIEVLCAELGVSLGAVREALSRLSSEDLILAVPQRGFVVAQVSAKDLRDLTNMRITVEGICLSEAIQIGDADWEREIRETLAELNATTIFHPDNGTLNQSWNAAHRRFHAALSSACENKRWLLLRDQLYDQSERYRQLSAPLAQHDRDVANEHIQIADYTLSRDTATALRLIGDHLQMTTDVLLARSNLWLAAQ